MKKFLGLVLFAFIGLSMVGGTEAEAQVYYGNRCCDVYNVPRCYISPPAPINYPCVCYGVPGVGHTC